MLGDVMILTPRSTNRDTCINIDHIEDVVLWQP